MNVAKMKKLRKRMQNLNFDISHLSCVPQHSTSHYEVRYDDQEHGSVFKPRKKKDLVIITSHKIQNTNITLTKERQRERRMVATLQNQKVYCCYNKIFQ